MKTVGIICECNPLHGGHLYLLEKAKASGADAVIAVMSGCFVQRGEPAVADPFIRAEILVRSGFDAVFELPFPHSSASSEFFCRSGVEILSRLGVDELWFGSECGDIALLSYFANIADSAEFQSRYSASVPSAGGTARAYFDCLKEMGGQRALSFDPNDILALSYLRAIRKTGNRMRPVTLKRVGSAYNETAPTKDFPSATALRLLWREKGFCAVSDLLPPACADLLREACKNGTSPASLEWLERAILSHFRLTSASDLEQIAELGGGLGSRMATLAQKACTLDEFLSLCATKKYTDARLRRGILFALAGIRQEQLHRPTAYVRLLAANKVGCAFLSSIRKTSEIPIVTRQTDLPDTPEANEAFAQECRARALFSLCTPIPTSAVTLICHTPVMINR